MKRKYLLSIMVAVLVIAAMLLPACAEEEATPAPTETPTLAPGETPTATPRETPTVAQEAKVYKWTVQGGQDAPGGKMWEAMDQEFADTVNALSGGRLIISPHGPGEIVPYAEMTQAVSDGTLDAVYNTAYYDIGRDVKCALISCQPFGFASGAVADMWMLEYGGLEDWNKIYNPWNIVALPGGAVGGQILGQTKIKTTGPSEWKEKGWVVRSSHLMSMTYVEAGLETIFLSGSEVFTAMERGVIDMMEYATPMWNYQFGYHEIAPYVYGPGLHEPSTIMALFVNKDRWEELPEDLQFLVQVALDHTAYRMEPAMKKLDLEAMKGMQAYFDQRGEGEFIRIPDSDMAMLYAARERVFEQLGSEDPEFARIAASIQQCQDDFDYLDNFVSDLSFDKSLVEQYR